MALASLKYLPIAGAPSRPADRAGQHGGGSDFPHAVGMAAGFDKDGEVPDALLGLGFGFAEVGSITPCRSRASQAARLFRLEEDRAVINRMGFNNGGAEAESACVRA
jgi:dihydroorotate dehydrogenase